VQLATLPSSRANCWPRPLPACVQFERRWASWVLVRSRAAPVLSWTTRSAISSMRASSCASFWVSRHARIRPRPLQIRVLQKAIPMKPRYSKAFSTAPKKQRRCGLKKEQWPTWTDRFSLGFACQGRASDPPQPSSSTARVTSSAEAAAQGRAISERVLVKYVLRSANLVVEAFSLRPTKLWRNLWRGESSVQLSAGRSGRI